MEVPVLILGWKSNFDQLTVGFLANICNVFIPNSKKGDQGFGYFEKKFLIARNKIKKGV